MPFFNEEIVSRDLIFRKTSWWFLFQVSKLVMIGPKFATPPYHIPDRQVAPNSDENSKISSHLIKPEAKFRGRAHHQKKNMKSASIMKTLLLLFAKSKNPSFKIQMLTFLWNVVVLYAWHHIEKQKDVPASSKQIQTLICQFFTQINLFSIFAWFCKSAKGMFPTTSHGTSA